MPSKLSELLLDESFVRFLKGKATTEEFAKWTEWSEQKEDHADLIEKGRELLNEGSQPLPLPNTEVELERLMWRIDSQKRYRSYKDVRKPSRTAVWSAIAVAASILLVIGFFTRHTLLQNNGTDNSQVSSVTYRTLNTETGQKTSVQYSDGSKIVINANSQLRLPGKSINSDTMQVWLEGEALFNITNNPDSKRTFIVHTPDGDVSVLGTIFSVNTTKSRSQVVLSEGRVRVDVSEPVNQQEMNYIMSPGELVEFSNEMDKIEIRNVNARVYTSWASDTLILENTPLHELIDRIEFTYDVSVKVEEDDLLNERLTGRLENLNIDFLLNGLAQVLDVEITKQERTVFIRKKEDDSITKGS
ncbi:FecR family protein [Gracilimonas sp. Q87]|uniref:FecR family protein n=1 Tax=Gracilimonas sp. Q87 TaxID=3384766 RepID=UPI0039843F79